MVSILIPAYNIDVAHLVDVLLVQAKRLNFPFEIIIADDGSTENFEHNRLLNNKEYCSYFKFEMNKGRTATRDWLANQAKYPWLLFVDSDTIPVHEDFYRQYISVIKTKVHYKVALGGYAYRKIDDFHFNLRLKFGRQREEIPAHIRMKEPYRYVFSGNLLIDKSVFLSCNPKDMTGYGLDLVLSGNLNCSEVKILHIDNPVFHDGLEDNLTFLNKCRETAEQIVQFEELKLIGPEQSKLLAIRQKIISKNLRAVVRGWLWLKLPLIKLFLQVGIAPLWYLDFYKLYFALKKRDIRF